MAAIRDAASIARKWATVTPQRSQDYADGIQNPKKDWQQRTEAANDAWKEGVSRAATADLFKKGVSAAGTAKWQTNALEKGPGRWQQGVALAQDAYEAGFAPFRAAIERTTLPPRFARRDPRNLARVKAIVDALIAVKTGSVPR